MSDRIDEHQVCPHCNSRSTHYTGNVGDRRVWRCSLCLRTFWPKSGSGSSVLLRIKNLFVGDTKASR